jgi:hypothetical protein
LFWGGGENLPEEAKCEKDLAITNEDYLRLRGLINENKSG